MWQDLRFALRQLRKSPVFSFVAVLTLALGIGANTAIFTLLDQALLRTLPVAHPEELVRLRFSGLHEGSINFYGGDEHDYFSYPNYRELRDKNTVLSGLIADDEAQVGVQWNNQPELASAELISGNYFDVLGVRPAMGRLILPSDDAGQNGNPVVALSFSTGRADLTPTLRPSAKRSWSTVTRSRLWAWCSRVFIARSPAIRRRFSFR